MGTLVRDETGVAGAVTVGHRAAEDLGDGLLLMLVEHLGSHESHLDPQIVHGDAPRTRLFGNMGKG